MNHAVSVHTARPPRRVLAKFGVAAATIAALVLGMAPTAAAAPAAAEAAPIVAQSEAAFLPAVAEGTGAGASQSVALNGRLVDGSGRQLQGLGYALEIWDGSGAPIKRSGTSGANGQISLSVAVAADAVYIGVLVQVTGHVVREEYREIELVNGAIALGDLVAERGGTLQGTLTVPAGSGRPDSVAIWALDGESPVASAYPIENGNGTWSWTVTVLPGTYKVQLAGDYGNFRERWSGGAAEQDQAASVKVAVDRTVTVDGSIELRANTVRGRMVDQQGAPVTGSVSIVGSPNGFRNVNTDADGRYLIAGIQPGQARVQFSPSEGVSQYWQNTREWSEATTLEFGDDTDHTSIDAIIDRGNTVTGRVAFSGVTEPWAQIALTRDFNATYGSIATDGSFAIRGLVDGQYGVRISTSSGTFETGRTVEVGGGVVDLGTVDVALGRLAGSVPVLADSYSNVEAYSTTGNQLVASFAANDGAYSTVLPVGDYRLVLVQNGDRQFYGGASNLATTPPVTVGLGQTAVADFASVTGSLGGRIVDESGRPLAGVTVELSAANDQQRVLRSVRSDADGAYRFDNLRRNNYVLQVSDEADDLRLVRWVGGNGSASDATAFSVDGERPVDAGRLTLPIAGAVRGTIDLPGSTGVWLYIGERQLAISEGAGEYVLRGVPVGTHDVRVTDSSGAQLALPRSVTVTAGTYTDFDLRYGSNVPSISGTITDAVTGRVVQSAYVSISEINGGWYGSISTGTAGTFSAYGLEPGEYRVSVQATGYSPVSLPEGDLGYTVTTGSTVRVDAALEPGVTVTGRVIDGRTGGGIAGAEVRSERSGSSYATTRSDGSYTITVPEGENHFTAAQRSTHVPSTRTVDVPASGIEGLNFSLTEGGTVSGTVVAANNGVPLDNVQVQLIHGGDSYRTWNSTDQNGAFRTDAVEDGVYDLDASNYRGLYVSNRVEDIAVKKDGVSDVVVPMELGGRIVGTYRDADGNPVPYATVGLARAADVSPVGRFTRLFGADNGAKLLEIETTTNADGSYELPAVAGGEYRLYAYTSEGGTTWFDGKRTLAEADPVEVAVGRTTTVAAVSRELGAEEVPRTPAETISDEFAITVQPRPVTVEAGGWAQFTAFATGTPSPTIQWQTRVAGGAWTDSDWATESTFMPSTDAVGKREVRAVFTQGDRELISNVADLVVEALPVAPVQAQAPRVGAVAGTTAALDWTAVDGAQHYDVRLFDAAGTQLRSVTVPTTSFVFSGLGGSTSYWASVTAVNAAGAGPESARTTFTTAALAVPSAPVEVAVTAADATSIRFAWAAPTTAGDAAITGYRATLTKRSGTVATQDVTTRFATFAGLTADTEYSVTVVAVSAAGPGAASAPLTARTAAAPVAQVPSALPAPVVTANGQRITATYSASGTGATSIEVRLLRGGSVVDTQTLPASSTTHSWSSLPAGSAHSVQLTGINEAGRGADSPLGTATTAALVAPFGDVPVSYQFFAEISWMASEGISTGYPVAGGGSEFRPWSPVTRDAMAAFLYRYAGSPEYVAPTVSPFRDVSTSSSFYKEIAWLASTGISTGWDVGGGKEFRPFSPITRDAMAAFLYRYAEVSYDAPSRSPFVDVTPASSSFYREITWLASEGISTGWDVQGGKAFKPFDNITRDAMAAFLYRADGVLD